MILSRVGVLGLLGGVLWALGRCGLDLGDPYIICPPARLRNNHPGGGGGRPSPSATLSVIGLV